MTDEPGEETGPNPLRAVAALVLIVVIFGAIWFVMHRLSQSAAMQDCLGSGRTNCAPLIK